MAGRWSLNRWASSHGLRMRLWWISASEKNVSLRWDTDYTASSSSLLLAFILFSITSYSILIVSFSSSSSDSFVILPWIYSFSLFLSSIWTSSYSGSISFFLSSLSRFSYSFNASISFCCSLILLSFVVSCSFCSFSRISLLTYLVIASFSPLKVVTCSFRSFISS